MWKPSTGPLGGGRRAHGAPSARCHEPDDERDGYEYYMLNQTDPRPSWYTIEVRYFQTRIFDTLGIALDGGRYFAPVPSCSFVRWGRPRFDLDFMYCYYTKDSLDWSLNEFFRWLDRKSVV